MTGAHNWLADERRAQRVFWLLIVVSIAGGTVSVAAHRPHSLVNDAALLINTGLVVAAMVIRALAVNARWLAALGVSLEVAAVTLHWHPLGAIDLLAPFPGGIVLVILFFYLHPPSPRHDNSGATIAVNATSLSDERAGPPKSASVRRLLPGDPDFTYPSPPR